MNKGQGVEFDHPYKLMTKLNNDKEITNKKGFFSKMVMSTGKETAESLFKIAMDNYFNS